MISSTARGSRGPSEIVDASLPRSSPNRSPNAGDVVRPSGPRVPTGSADHPARTRARQRRERRPRPSGRRRRCTRTAVRRARLRRGSSRSAPVGRERHPTALTHSSQCRRVSDAPAGVGERRARHDGEAVGAAQIDERVENTRLAGARRSDDENTHADAAQHSLGARRQRSQLGIAPTDRGPHSRIERSDRAADPTEAPERGRMPGPRPTGRREHPRFPERDRTGLMAPRSPS